MVWHLSMMCRVPRTPGAGEFVRQIGGRKTRSRHDAFARYGKNGSYPGSTPSVRQTHKYESHSHDCFIGPFAYARNDNSVFAPCNAGVNGRHPLHTHRCGQSLEAGSGDPPSGGARAHRRPSGQAARPTVTPWRVALPAKPLMTSSPREQ